MKEKPREPDADDNELNTGKLLSELHRRLQEIETDEILHCQTAEELDARGFINERAVNIDRSEHMRARLSAGYSFPPGVEFLAHPPVRSVAEIDLTELKELPVVAAGSTTVTRSLPDSHAHRMPGDLQGKNYLDECHFDITIEGDKMRFVPRVRGRLVLAGESLYLIPADREGKCTVRLMDDNMKALVDFSPPAGNGQVPALIDVIAELKKMGVKTGLCVGDIEAGLAALRQSGNPVLDVVAAMGKPPIDGKDSEIEYHFDTKPTREESRILPDGRIDYRTSANIPIVSEGDTLATVGEPLSGTDGFDLFGNIVKARHGESSVLCPGLNVTVDSERVFRAACSGQVSLNRNVLDVFQHYSVAGDVDYGSGNIRFNGNVTVKGNVHPGFEVVAEGDIEVYGTSDGAVLKAGRDIRVNGGIIGRGDAVDARISCGRNLSAKHIQNGYIEAQGDVLVKNSIVQSTIRAGGSVHLRGGAKASVIGGSVCALDGIAATNIGSEYGVRTLVEAGNDYLVNKACAEIDKAIQFCENSIKKIDQVFVTLKSMLARGSALDADKQTKMQQIKEKREQLNKYRSTMEWKKKSLRKQSPRNTGARIQASQTAFADVLVRIVDAQIVLKAPLQRIFFRYDAGRKEVVAVAKSGGIDSSRGDS